MGNGKSTNFKGTNNEIVYEKVSELDPQHMVQIRTYLDDNSSIPEYYVYELKLADSARKFWIIENCSFGCDGNPSVRPPVFADYDDAVKCADSLLREYEQKNLTKVLLDAIESCESHPEKQTKCPLCGKTFKKTIIGETTWMYSCENKNCLLSEQFVFQGL